MSSPDAFHAMLEPAEVSGPPADVVGLGEPIVPRRSLTVKCPRCLTVGTTDDVQCVACRAPLGDEPNAVRPVDRGRRAARLGLLFLAIGAGLGPMLGNGTPLIGRPAGGQTVNLLLWACLSGGLGAVLGYAIGWARSRRR